MEVVGYSRCFQRGVNKGPDKGMVGLGTKGGRVRLNTKGDRCYVNYSFDPPPKKKINQKKRDYSKE